MKRIILLVITIILIGGIGFRIWNINQAVELTPVHTYAIGEEVIIGKNIFLDDYENMEGYTVTVNHAEVLSYDEFMTKYNYDEDKIEFDRNDYFYPEMIYDLNLTIKNTNQTEDPREFKGISFLNYNLYGTNLRLEISHDLYPIANSELEHAASDGFSLQLDSEMDFNLPFFFAPSGKISPIQTETVVNDEIYLVVSMYPEVNRILIE